MRNKPTEVLLELAQARVKMLQSRMKKEKAVMEYKKVKK